MKFSSNDEIFAHLDRLNEQTRATQQMWLSRLQRSVDGLGVAGQPDAPDEYQPRPGSRPGDRPPRRGPDPEPAPYFALPERTTHGGPFGPKVREKIIREGLAKRGW